MYVGSNSTASVNGMQISGASTTGAITTILGAVATNVELSTKYLMINGHYEV
jgi:hypothetical protein